MKKETITILKTQILVYHKKSFAFWKEKILLILFCIVRGGRMKADGKVKIIKHLGVLSTSKSGWSTELNLVTWFLDNGGAITKYDIRDWSADHAEYGKGFGLSEKEYEALIDIIKSNSKNNAENSVTLRNFSL